MYIPIHKIDDGFMANMSERVQMSFDNLPRLIEAVRSRPWNLDVLASAAHTAAAFCYLLDPHSEKISDAFDISRRALNALFSCALNATNPTVVVFKNYEPIIFLEKPNAGSVHVANWLDGFFLNLILGDFESLRQLCRFPTMFLRKSPTRASEYMYLYKDALCAYINEEPDAVDRIIAVLKATEPNRPDIADEFMMLSLSVPQLEVFLYAICGDIRFGASMQRAVENHKNFWSSSEDNSRSPRGFISIELLGLAVLGGDAGLSFDVDSPYLPLNLIHEVH